MVSTRGPRYRFGEGERVLCYEPDPTKAKVLYDSKVLEVIESKDKRGRRTVEYLIHFQGWNSSWDRCVSEDFVLKDTEENRQLQRDLAEKSQLQLGAYLYRRERKKGSGSTSGGNTSGSGGGGASTSGPGPAKRTRHSGNFDDDDSLSSTQNDEGDTDSSSGGSGSGTSQPAVPAPPTTQGRAHIQLPSALRDRLTFDFHLVVKRGRLSSLPASPCVAEILESFVRWFARAGAWNAQSRNPRSRRTLPANAQRPDLMDVSRRLNLVREVADGVRIYFDYLLLGHLLYKQEVNQYNEIVGKAIERPVAVSKIEVKIEPEDLTEQIKTEPSDEIRTFIKEEPLDHIEEETGHKQEETDYKQDEKCYKQDETSHEQDQTSQKQDETRHNHNETDPKQDKTILKDETCHKHSETVHKFSETGHKQDMTDNKQDETSYKQDETAHKQDEIKDTQDEEDKDDVEIFLMSPKIQEYSHLPPSPEIIAGNTTVKEEPPETPVKTEPPEGSPGQSRKEHRSREVKPDSVARRLRSQKNSVASQAEAEELAPSMLQPVDTQPQRSVDPPTTRSSASSERRDSESSVGEGLLSRRSSRHSSTQPLDQPGVRAPLSALLDKAANWHVIPREGTDQLPCRVYGAIHLSRLFVKLPDFLNAIHMPDTKLKLLLKHIDMFVQYLDEHSEWFGETYYVADCQSRTR